MPRLRSASATAANPPVVAPTPISALRARDLRGTVPAGPLRFPAGDRVVVSGLPGSGKSTLIDRTVAVGDRVRRIDSQEVRARWERRLPAAVPYGLYRPLVRLAHFARLRRALASGAGVVVHDCGTQGWVRRWLAADAVRRGRGVHLVLLDVTPGEALAGQAQRGRAVSVYAFLRHRRAARRLLADAQAGRLPAGCASVALLDRRAAAALRGIVFE